MGGARSPPKKVAGRGPAPRPRDHRTSVAFRIGRLGLALVEDQRWLS